MIVIVGALIGAILGAVIAKRRGGGVLDIAQYAGSFAIAFAVFGLIATVLIERSLV